MLTNQPRSLGIIYRQEIVIFMSEPIQQKKRPVKKGSFANTIKGSLYWWLRYDKPFIINDEYSLKLLHIDKIKDMVKILITNLKTEKQSVLELGDEDSEVNFNK